MQGDNFTEFPASTTWLANTAYTAGSSRATDAAERLLLSMHHGGTSGTGEPSWPTSAGATCQDGTDHLDCLSKQLPFFAFTAAQLTLYGSNPLAGGALDTTAQNFQVNHPEQFIVGDLIDILDPTNPAIRDSARITAISGKPSPSPRNLPSSTSGFSTWTANTAYTTASPPVVPSPANGYYYVCLAGGTSSATPPTWPTTVGTTFTDGSVIWNTNAMLTGTLGNSYPLGAIVRAGQPGRPTVYIGDVTGELRAANPEVMESYYPLYNETRGNEPEQHWLQTASAYLGEVVGAPAVDSNLGRVYVSSLAGRLFAFLENGQLAWVYPTLDQPALGPLHTAPAVDDAGNIYFAADSGSMHHGRHLAAEYRLYRWLCRATGDTQRLLLYLHRDRHQRRHPADLADHGRGHGHRWRHHLDHDHAAAGQPGLYADPGRHARREHV